MKIKEALTVLIGGDPDPSELSVDNAYKTRWVWYHLILALELLITNVVLVAILTKI